MHIDSFGQMIFDENDIFDLYLKNPNIKFKSILANDQITFDQQLSLDTIPNIVYPKTYKNIKDFDTYNQGIWFMPEEYLQMDIAKYILDQCKSGAELQRAGTELLLYQEKNMFNLLRYLKYLVDTMRKNNVVWGVGRGSSVSSFVLYLIGIHRINSLYYDLPIEEFLK